MHHAGDDDGGEDGPPARLDYHHTQNLSFLLLNVNLPGTTRNLQKNKLFLLQEELWKSNIHYSNIYDDTIQPECEGSLLQLMYVQTQNANGYVWDTLHFQYTIIVKGGNHRL